jgi:hypothetical protein
LRQLHNFALEINWLPAIIIPRPQWPAVRYEEKRVEITDNPEWFAKKNLGHNSEAGRSACACRAVVTVPSLEEYEQRAM